MTEYRAIVDGAISFSNGGGMQVQGFRLDLPGRDIAQQEIETLLVAALGLILADDVRLDFVEVIEEPHKGTPGGPRGPDATAKNRAATGLVDLSHVITAHMVTLPGLPGPEITRYLTREAAEKVYARGTTFEIARISMVANTGTYVDSPHHRFAGGVDLSGLDLASLADVPAIVVKLRDARYGGIGVEPLAAYDVQGLAVLLETGDCERFGTPAYVEETSFLTGEGASWLVEHGVALVGIDAANIDDMTDKSRPAHTILLEAGIPIVEHLTGLEAVPPRGARFFAVPPKVADFGTFPVRAFAVVPTGLGRTSERGCRGDRPDGRGVRDRPVPVAQLARQ